jgi:hypothetical protein
MKKVLFIGDIHGRTDWRETALQGMKKFQEVVFLGDYFDSFDISAALQIDNFMAFLSFIKKKGGTALLGNHDYAYIHGKSGISGYQYTQAHKYQQLLNDNIDHFKIAWGYRDDKQNYTLASHAGITQTFWNRFVLPLFEKGEFLYNITEGKGPTDLEIHETLNFLRDKKDLMWKVGSMRGGMGTPGPLWADIRELLEDPYPGINQVVGHTVNHAISLDFNDDNFIARVDSYGKNTAGLVISL